MRIVFLGVDDEFAGAMQKTIFERHPDWVTASFISSCAVYKKSRIGSVLFLLDRSGLSYLLAMIKTKLLRKMLLGEKVVTPLKLAREYGKSIYWTKNINSDESIAQLTRLSPDLVISTNFNQYIGGRVQKVARFGTWNLHKSLLPKYRGMAPSFYALLNGEKTVGATLHKVASSFDTGAIIRQVEIPVHDNDSVYSLNLRISTKGGEMLNQVIDRGDLTDIKVVPQPSGDWPYRSYPTKSEIKEFLQRGRCF